MIVFGIEGIVYIFGIGIVIEKSVFVNVFDIFIMEKGGIYLKEVVEYYVRLLKLFFRKVFEIVGVMMEDVDLIVFF